MGTRPPSFVFISAYCMQAIKKKAGGGKWPGISLVPRPFPPPVFDPILGTRLAWN